MLELCGADVSVSVAMDHGLPLMSIKQQVLT